MRLAGALAVLILVTQTVSAEDAPELDAAARQKLDALVTKLGADDFKTRQDAETALSEYKKPAVEALKKHLEQSKDLEIISRLKRVIQRIEIGATSAEIIAQIEKQADIAAKTQDSNKRADELKKLDELLAALQKTDGPDIQIADAFKSTGRKLFEAGQAKANVKAAMKYLEQSVEWYEKAMKAGDKNAENRLQEASMLLYSCRKFLTL